MKREREKKNESRSYMNPRFGKDRKEQLDIKRN